ncbi:hypothetical protein D9758_018933 [Tetrapyrgos nigripes]|uniref:Uncharacterized protein n=1 Tax=Tetrapyrgos nigripes TaxID=182062 RepID=A0A8H5AR96_9AGAR|nr:hypothetical protein D9758_018933 [Tetrapyrgos nigripes]
MTKKPATSKGELKKVSGGSAGKRAKAVLLGNATNIDINALLAVAAAQLREANNNDAGSDTEASDLDVEDQPATEAGPTLAAATEEDEISTGNNVGADAAGKEVPQDVDITQLRAQLAELMEKNKSLEQQLQAAPPSTDTATIPRPRGTAGKDFSIQVAMNLAGSVAKDVKYKALQRRVKDLVGHARVPYDIPWKDVAVQTKSLLFEAARQDQPFLRRYQNDWATEELSKQYLKNKRKNAYKNGWLKVSDKYTYLKQNAACRSALGQRSSKAKAVRESREAKRAAKRTQKTAEKDKNSSAAGWG